MSRVLFLQRRIVGYQQRGKVKIGEKVHSSGDCCAMPIKRWFRLLSKQSLDSYALRVSCFIFAAGQRGGNTNAMQRLFGSR